MEIDDILVEAKDSDEAAETFRQILQRCREKNIKLARYKLQAGSELDFAGVHLGGPEGFKPTQSKIDAILRLPPPSNVAELRSFLGAWNQMRDYLPDLSHSTANMTKLLRKDTPFIWDKILNDEFEAIKGILRSPIGLHRTPALQK